jgi:integrase
MPRKAKGTTFVSDGSIYASVTIAPKKKLARALPFLRVTDEAAARDWAGALQELVDALRAAGLDGEIAKKVGVAVQAGIDDPKGGLAQVHKGIAKVRAELAPVTLAAVPTKAKQETVKTFGERWTTGKLHDEYPDHVSKKKTSFKDAQILERWVYEPVGHIALGAFRLQDAQEVLRRVPRSLSSSTRRHVAQAMVRLFHLAVYPCQLIAASPIPKGFLPKVHTRPTAYLYPKEDRSLLAHKRVPLVNRILYGFLAREGMRREEARLLTWADLDLNHGSVRLDTNKTNDPRAWALDPGVVKALAWWKKKQNDPPRTARVFGDIVNPQRLPTALQEHLELAGVDRPELFEHNEKRRRVNIHALRATFVTLSLANGKSEAWVQDRTGHRSSVMVNRYRRVARTAAELRLGALASLDSAIPEIRANRRARRRAA